jgi:tripartite-type tricarboxylate transporter receptor subunit TctC
VLGVTGKLPAQGIAPMAKQGFNDVENMGNPQQLIVPKTVPVAQQEEWHNILTQAARATDVQTAYAADSCQAARNSFKETQQLFETQTQFWRKITANVKVQ